MKIRSQLVRAFLLLSVVPLSAIVLYGYVASERAVRQAVEAEARSLTREMEGRMSGLRAELEQRFARLAELPLGAWQQHGSRPIRGSSVRWPVKLAISPPCSMPSSSCPARRRRPSQASWSRRRRPPRRCRSAAW